MSRLSICVWNTGKVAGLTWTRVEDLNDFGGMWRWNVRNVILLVDFDRLQLVHTSRLDMCVCLLWSFWFLSNHSSRKSRLWTSQPKQCERGLIAHRLTVNGTWTSFFWFDVVGIFCVCVCLSQWKEPSIAMRLTQSAKIKVTFEKQIAHKANYAKCESCKLSNFHTILLLSCRQVKCKRHLCMILFCGLPLCFCFIFSKIFIRGKRKKKKSFRSCQNGHLSTIG